jgi:chemotaxis protein methyltransferase CheR
MSSSRHDFSHICFEGSGLPRQRRPRLHRACLTTVTSAAIAVEESLDEFISWVLEQAGLDASAYRAQSLHRRLPACLRAMKVGSSCAARELLERKPQLVPKAVSSLLIGVTEFFREPGVFDYLSKQVLPALAGCSRPLRVWSAACSTGAELYSMAILLSETGLLDRSYLLGTDCRCDAIDRANAAIYDAMAVKLLGRAARHKFFEPIGKYWRPIGDLRRHVHWKAADLLAGAENGPWDIILWRNAAIYLKPCRAEMIWRSLASALGPQGVIVGGKADRPPDNAGLTSLARCIYRVAEDSVGGATDPGWQLRLSMSAGKN